MTKKKKICVVIASRANYGRIKTALTAIKEHPELELQIIVAASAMLNRFGGAVDVIKKDGFLIDATVYSIVEGENLTTMAKSTGLGIIELATLFEGLSPDIVLTVGDRFETISTAIAASYMNIFVAHTQGGELTGSIDESVRHAISKLSHIHFTTTDKAKERVLQMGEDPSFVFNTGCPAIDVVTENDLSISNAQLENYGGVGTVVDVTKPYLVVLQHPVTTEFGSGLSQIQQTLEAVRVMGVQAVWLWPNIDAGSDDISKGLRVFRERHPDVPINFYRNFKPEDYVCLINNCVCLVGNSSSAIREGAYLGIPAVNIGTRQQLRERASNVVDVGYDTNEIACAIKSQIEHGRYPSSHLYGSGKSGQLIAELLAKTELKIQKTFFDQS